MVLSFIPVGFATAFLTIGVLALFVPKVRSFLRFLPLLSPQVWAFVLIAVGVLAGGVAFYQSQLSGLGINTATITGTQQQAITETLLDNCVYSSAAGVVGNLTIRQDLSSSNKVFGDLDESEYKVSGVDGMLTNEISANFTCARKGDVSKAGSVQVVVKAFPFRSEVSTTDVNEYNVVDTNARPSSVWTGKYEQNIYIADDGYTTASSKEYAYLNYAEGAKETTLSFGADVDQASFAKVNNYTQVMVVAYQRTLSGDIPIAYYVVQKTA